MTRRYALIVLLVLTLVLSACSVGQPLLVTPVPTSAVAQPPVEHQATVMPSPETTASVGVDEMNPSQLDPGDLLPMAPQVRVGRLDNGLTYYVRENSEPANRAELWLIINAGSALEDDDQLGLAHFLEHMLFNGTRRFEGQALIDFFESIGMEFGPDINAYTSFDETVYTIQVPTNSDADIETAFQVLEDWAGYATLSPEEIDKERGVIVEEWRLRDLNASGRIRDQILPTLLGDSRYLARLPIGDMDVVRDAPPEALRRYYETWYRPDLMALVAVGDFQDDQIEARIREHFSTLTVPEDPVQRTAYSLPDHEETRYQVVTDPEQPYTTLDVSVKQPARKVRTVDDYRDLVIRYLFTFTFNRRLDELTRQEDAPFLLAQASTGNLVRPVDVYSVSAQVEDGGVIAGLDAVMTEIERVRRHGFTESEIERAKKDVLRFFEAAYAERENRDSAAHAQEYRDHFLANQASPGIEFELKLVQDLLPGIALEDVNRVAEDLVGQANRTVILIAPEKEDVTLPDEADLASAVEAVQTKAIDPYVDTSAGLSLMEEIPEAAAIVDELAIPELEVTEIELDNGVRVIMKPTDFREEEVVFTAISPGGSSLVSDADFPEAAVVEFVVAQSGIGNLTYPELTRLLSGKRVGVNPSIDELTEGLGGSASTEDLETLFQLIHLYVAEPRVDEAAFTRIQDQLRAALANRDLNPNAALQDALSEALYGDTIRRGTLPLEEVEALDLDKAFEIYQDRFGDASDFTFVFVGSFDVDTLTALAQTYLGSLRGSDREETWVDVAPDPPEGVVERDVFEGLEDRSIVQLVFTGTMDPTPENQLRLALLERVLDILIREDLREERAGIYSAFIGSGVAEEPDQTYTVSIAFSADPERVDELVGAVFAQIEDLRNNGPSAENLVKIKEQESRDFEEALEDNGFWLGLLSEYAFDPEEDVLGVLSYQDRIDAQSVEDIRQAAQELLSPDRFVRVVLYPKALEPVGQ